MWTLEYSPRCVRNAIDSGEYAKWTAFANVIRQGKHPRTSSIENGHMSYENLGGNLYSVRLSQKDRVYFRLDEGREVCTIEQIGGHR